MTTAISMPASTVAAGPLPARRKDDRVGPKQQSRTARLLAVLIAVGLLALAAWVVVARPYEPGSELGYNLGLAGGLLMLALLLYPLRKRIRVFGRVGRMGDWFRFHMVAGIGGPVLIVFHSTFKIGSLNGRVALYAMLLVAASGVVGRFLYHHVHRGLNGRRLTLEEAQAELRSSGDQVNSVFSLRPDVESRLKTFHDKAFAPPAGVGAGVWRFVTLRLSGRRLARAILHDVKLALAQRLRRDGLSRHELGLSYRLAREQVRAYVEAVVRTSQLAGWERLFSFWHLVHIPFLYLLVFSGIVHVVAVHMY